MRARARDVWLILVPTVLVAILGTGVGTTLAIATASRIVDGNTLTAASSFCRGGSQTLTASADSYVNQASATTNFGSATTLTVSSANSNKNQRTLVTFVLPSVPANCSLLGATLQLYATTVKTGRTYQAYQAAASWTETGVTWNNQPATTGTPASAATGAGWVSWGVTSLVAAMYTGSNYGFLVKDSVESSSSTATNIYSSRTGTNPPQLVLTWG